MKVTLIQPGLDRQYACQKQAYGHAEQLPETGLAVLSAWISAYSKAKPDIVVADPSIGIEKAASIAADSDILGVSDWFSNHENCMKLAELAKEKNPDIKVVVGGPNASMMPELILKNHPYIDFIAQRDGEDALLGVVDGWPLSKIPNLWFRAQNGKPAFTFHGFTDLAKMPLWDFRNFQNVERRLKAYRKYQNNSDPWLVSPITIFSLRGCIKAVREGPCYYCTSSQAHLGILPAEKFWKQITHLNKTHGANLLFVCDDVFPITAKRVSELRKSKPSGIKPRIRAYGYLPVLSAMDDRQLAKTARELSEIGIHSLFFGTENFGPGILANMNKKTVSIEQTLKIMRALYSNAGIKSMPTFLIGLPGETNESLKSNMLALEKIAHEEYFERLYISVAMPLAGTPWFRMLSASPQVRKQYFEETGKVLENDDYLRYSALTKIAISNFTKVTPEAVNNAVAEMMRIAGKSIPKHRIGGFFLEGS